MTTTQFIDILLKDGIIEDIRTLLTRIILNTRLVSDNTDDISKFIKSEFLSNYNGISLDDRNINVINKFVKSTIKGTVKVNYLRMDDLFITLLHDKGVNLEKYDGSLAVVCRDFVKYTDHTPVVMNCIVTLSKTQDSLTVLCHELVHVMIRYNRVIHEMDLTFDADIDQDMAEEFVCDVISTMVMSDSLWTYDFDELMKDILPEYKDFYTLEYTKLK